ncbi:MAG: M3 family oligoendopeptidase [Bacteroidia bacterium]
MSFEKSQRNILPQEFDLKQYSDIEPFLKSLLSKNFESKETLEKWIYEYSEIDAYLSENLAWRYINYTRHTDNEALSNAYSFFIKEIQPELVKVENQLNKKQTSSEYFDSLPDNELLNYKKKANLSIELFREENIALEVEQSNLSQEYASIIGAMSIDMDGKELTMQQAAKLLQGENRKERKEVFEKINEKRLENKDKLDGLFDKLTELRQQQAKNCGFENYRDFKHKALGRFDYTVDDAKKFQNAIERVAVPYLGKLLQKRKSALGFETLRPYDLAVNIYDSKPLKPFESGSELLDKSIKCFDTIDPFFGDVLRAMKEKGFVDLESRKGKAPGGYNYPLDEHGLPFIFMNASGSMRDVTTMVHEGGHAIHTVLARDLKVNALKHCPSEVAELASMSMELISMDAWNVFFDNEKDLLRAKIEQLEGVLDVLPWIATVDNFQHWIYTNTPNGSEERDAGWIEILNKFSSNIVDHTGYENFRRNQWQKQLHIFEVPFYYIEYGIAQLGAIALWRNYKKNSGKALDEYKAALSLGYTKTIPEIYNTAGIKFDFSEEYVAELLDFIWNEYSELVDEYHSLKD